MRYEVSSFVHEGPPQARRIVGLQLTNGSEITSECAIAMIQRHGAEFRQWTGDRWKEVQLIRRKVWTFEIDG
jgi:hypothetical protein